jgi:hypothetical protein
MRVGYGYITCCWKSEQPSGVKTHHQPVHIADCASVSITLTNEEKMSQAPIFGTEQSVVQNR